MAMPDSKQYLYVIINNVEEIVDFLGLKVFNYDNSLMFSFSRIARVNYMKKPQMKATFKKDKSIDI